MMMLRYHLASLSHRFHAWRKERKARAAIYAQLRAAGFVETAPGQWDKPL